MLNLPIRLLITTIWPERLLIMDGSTALVRPTAPKKSVSMILRRVSMDVSAARPRWEMPPQLMRTSMRPNLSSTRATALSNAVESSRSRGSTRWLSAEAHPALTSPSR